MRDQRSTSFANARAMRHSPYGPNLPTENSCAKEPFLMNELRKVMTSHVPNPHLRQCPPRIAILGCGSLIWEPRELETIGGVADRRTCASHRVFPRLAVDYLAGLEESIKAIALAYIRNALPEVATPVRERVAQLLL